MDQRQHRGNPEDRHAGTPAMGGPAAQTRLPACAGRVAASRRGWPCPGCCGRSGGQGLALEDFPGMPGQVAGSREDGAAPGLQLASVQLVDHLAGGGAGGEGS